MEHTAIIDMMTPYLLLPNGVKSYHKAGRITASWFGVSVEFEVDELSPTEVVTYGLATAVMHHLYDLAPVTREELTAHGCLARTSTGVHTFLRRGRSLLRDPLPYEEQLTLARPQPSGFLVEQSGGLISISSKEPHLPHEAVAYDIDFLAQVTQDVYDINHDTNVILFPHPARPVVLGHASLIERFSHDLQAPHVVVSADKLQSIR